jgi:hypothetical protein
MFGIDAANTSLRPDSVDENMTASPFGLKRTSR